MGELGLRVQGVQFTQRRTNYEGGWNAAHKKAIQAAFRSAKSIHAIG